LTSAQWRTWTASFENGFISATKGCLSATIEIRLSAGFKSWSITSLELRLAAAPEFRPIAARAELAPH
jgi:hypothetical protein